MVRIRRFHCRGPGSIPGLGTEMPQAAAPLGDASQIPFKDQPAPGTEQAPWLRGTNIFLLHVFFH